MINQIICGDCLEIMPKISTGFVDMILCDLPYGITKCWFDDPLPLDKLWESYKRLIKPNGAIVLFGKQPFSSQLINSNLKMFRYEWIWEKGNGTGFLNAKKMPMVTHENILVFYKHLPTYNPQLTHGHERKTTSRTGTKTECYGKSDRKSEYNSTSRYPRSVQFFSSDKQKERKLHPTLKPLALFEYLVKTYTNPGDVVLDSCAGACTTALACKNTDRNYICIEIDNEYCKIGENRIKNNETGGIVE